MVGETFGSGSGGGARALSVSDSGEDLVGSGAQEVCTDVLAAV